MFEISVANDFSQFPAGRFRSDGPWSGEKFRLELLVPALEEHDKVRVLLDGTMGYGSSFLEEAFGALVRDHGYSVNALRTGLEVVSEDDPSLVQEVWSYVESAGRDSTRRVSTA